MHPTEKRYIVATRPNDPSQANPQGRPNRTAGIKTGRIIQHLIDTGWTIERNEPVGPTSRELDQRLADSDAKHDALIDTLVSRGQLPEADADQLRRQPNESREIKP